MQPVYIFLASPGDVSKEKAIAEEVVADLNRAICHDNNLNLIVKEWKKNAYPGYGSDAQAIINEQIADMSGYDLFVGIMWNRLGTPTPRAESGTVEEFERAVDSRKKCGRPEIWFYFREAKSELKSDQELEQRKKVLAFKKRVESNGLPYGHKTPARFKEEFRQHLTLWLNKKLSRIRDAKPSVDASPSAKHQMPAKGDRTQTIAEAIADYKSQIDVAWRGGFGKDGKPLHHTDGSTLGKWVEMETHQDFKDASDKPS